MAPNQTTNPAAATMRRRLKAEMQPRRTRRTSKSL
jgi:hypothetical protein